MAARLAADIKDSLSVDSILVKGGGGVFEVSLDGELIFSKKATRRFPEKGEIEKIIRNS